MGIEQSKVETADIDLLSKLRDRADQYESKQSSPNTTLLQQNQGLSECNIDVMAAQ